MRASELREMSIEELESELDATREELMRLRFQMKTGELTDHSRLNITRRTVARMMTVLSELQAAESEGEA